MPDIQSDTRPSLELLEFQKVCAEYDSSDKTLRFGQFFHQRFHLEKMTSIKDVCDRIYYEPVRFKAAALIHSTFDIS